MKKQGLGRDKPVGDNITRNLARVRPGRWGGPEAVTDFLVWLYLPTPRKVGLNIPIRSSGGWAFFLIKKLLKLCRVSPVVPS